MSENVLGKFFQFKFKCGDFRFCQCFSGAMLECGYQQKRKGWKDAGGLTVEAFREYEGI